MRDMRNGDIQRERERERGRERERERERETYHLAKRPAIEKVTTYKKPAQPLGEEWHAR